MHVCMYKHMYVREDTVITRVRIDRKLLDGWDWRLYDVITPTWQWRSCPKKIQTSTYGTGPRQPRTSELLLFLIVSCEAHAVIITLHRATHICNAVLVPQANYITTSDRRYLYTFHEFVIRNQFRPICRLIEKILKSPVETFFPVDYLKALATRTYDTRIDLIKLMYPKDFWIHGFAATNDRIKKLIICIFLNC